MKNTNSKSGSYHTVIAIILFFALIVGNYFQYQLTPLAGQLMEGFGITPNQFSSIFTSPMITSIILGIVAGVLVDKYGFKKVIAIALILAAVGLCIRPFAGSYGTLFATMILGGLGIQTCPRSSVNGTHPRRLALLWVLSWQETRLDRPSGQQPPPCSRL